MIESRTARSFRVAFAELPKEIQDQARRAYRLFCADPSHPSLRFKKVSGREDIYSVRIGLGYRALGLLEGSVVTWFWTALMPTMIASSDLAAPFHQPTLSPTGLPSFGRCTRDIFRRWGALTSPAVPTPTLRPVVFARSFAVRSSSSW